MKWSFEAEKQWTRTQWPVLSKNNESLFWQYVWLFQPKEEYSDSHTPKARGFNFWDWEAPAVSLSIHLPGWHPLFSCPLLSQRLAAHSLLSWAPTQSLKCISVSISICSFWAHQPGPGVFLNSTTTQADTTTGRKKTHLFSLKLGYQNILNSTKQDILFSILL